MVYVADTVRGDCLACNRSSTRTSDEVHVLKKRRSAMRKSEEVKIGYILLWLLGIPIPILLVVFFLRGCN